MKYQKTKYSFEEIFSQEKQKEIANVTAIGIDIGSRQGKAVLLHSGNVYVAIQVTGFSMQQTAEQLLADLLSQAGITEREVQYLIGTGYGRVSMHFDKISSDMLTEISCHGMGAAYLGDRVKTVLDIGGQDSKIIKIRPDTGQVLDFAMNDKCAAGTGRFLERAAELLGYEVTQIGEASLQAKEIHEISSQCVVFAESEIVSARAAGIDSRDILAGVHASVIGRVKGLFKRLGIEKEVMFTGGVSNNVGMRKALEDMLEFEIVKPSLNSVYAGALGAALYAAKRGAGTKSTGKEAKGEHEQEEQNGLELTSLEKAVEQAKQNYIEHKNGKINVAYTCAYTPLELLDAAGVRHVRLFHTGNEKEIAAGEAVVSKITCDHIKSFVGGFVEGKPLYQAVDKIYSLYTCSFMTSAVRSVQAQFKPVKLLAVPKLLEDDRSIGHYVQELEELKKDLETLTGTVITEEAIQASIKKYNQARAMLREISDYRKEKYPILSSLQYQRIAVAYYYLPVDILLEELAGIRKQLKKLSSISKEHEKDSASPLRIMITGGVNTEDDRKVVRILEEEFGVSVVVEDHCSGYAPFVMSIPEGVDGLEAIAEGYLGKSPCANLKPLRKKAERTLQIAKEYKPDGVIYYFLQFCPTHGMAKQTIMDDLQKAGFPVIDIAGSYSDGDEGQIRTRMEAFLEILRKNRGESHV